MSTGNSTRIRGTHGLNRRKFLEGVGLGFGAISLARGRGAWAAAPFDNADFDIEAARREGPVQLWHSDQEPDVVQYLKAYTERTGLPAQQLRISTGAALPKLKAELRTGNLSCDVFNCTDDGLMDQMREEGLLMRYETPEIGAYSKQFRSAEPGYYTTFYVNIGPMMYDTRYVSEEIAPKDWFGLLDPKWERQIGVQVAAAGSQYAWWYLLKDVLPADYWSKLAKQKPRAYATSSQMVNDIYSGSLKIGAKVSIFQYTKAMRSNIPVRVVFPEAGTPVSNAVTGIIAETKRPNAAKAFVHFLLSKEGQQIWNEIQGSPSARPDVKIEGLPSVTQVKLLTVTDFADYRSAARHKEFASVWAKVVGF